MRLPLLLALTAVGACATSAPDAGSGPPASAGVTAAVPTANVAVIREPEGGGVVFVSFEAGDDVVISPGHALRIETPAGSFEAPIDGVPQQAVEGAATGPAAQYRLAEAGVRALDAAGERARVSVHDGRAYRRYGVRRSDVVE